MMMPANFSAVNAEVVYGGAVADYLPNAWTAESVKRFNSNIITLVSNSFTGMLLNATLGTMFGGNWDWSVLNQYDYTENMGLMPVPQNTDDGSNEKLVGGGSKYFFIDSSDNTSDEQRKAAKDFLNWLAEDKEGQEFISKDAALISPFKNNSIEAADPLGKSVKSYADAGKLIDNYNYLPDDHFSVLGAAFQKWLAGEEDRAGLAQDIQDYWKTAKFTGATA